MQIWAIRARLPPAPCPGRIGRGSPSRQVCSLLPVFPQFCSCHCAYAFLIFLACAPRYCLGSYVPCSVMFSLYPFHSTCFKVYVYNVCINPFLSTGSVTCLFSYFTLCFIFMSWLPFLPLDTALFFPFFRLFCLIYVIDACLHCYSRCCAQGYVVLLLLLLLPFCFRLAIHCIGHVVLLLLLLSTFCSRAAILLDAI